jgi:hypothetical protein
MLYRYHKMNSRDRIMLKETDMPHNTTPLLFKMKALKDIGYTQEYQISEKGLTNLNTGKIFQPAQIKIMDRFRYEGISDPQDMAILYTLVATNGEKGLIIDAFGPYGNQDLMDFIKQVKDQTISFL